MSGKPGHPWHPGETDQEERDRVEAILDAYARGDHDLARALEATQVKIEDERTGPAQ